MSFILGLILAIAAIVVFFFLGRGDLPEKAKTLRMITVPPLALLSFGLIVWSSAIYVNDDEGGIVIKKLGTKLPATKIIAMSGLSVEDAEEFGVDGLLPKPFTRNQFLDSVRNVLEA